MKKIVLFLFLFTSVSFSQNSNIDWLLVHNLSIDGINELYNLNVSKAEENFNRVIQIAPLDPRGYFFNCILYFLRFSLERNRPDFDNFFLNSEKVINVCTELIDRNKQDYNARFYLAGIYGYMGLMYQLDNSIVKAVWDGKKGFGMLKDIVEEKPDMYDAYLGTGLFDYLLAKIPKGYAWILKLLGYGGDKERGLQELKTAEEKGVYTRTEAALYLSQFLSFEERWEEAFYYIKKLIKQYPENSLFLVAYGNMENRLNKTEYAIAAYKKALEINKRKKINPADELIYLNYANALFSINDFPECIKNYESYLSRVSNKDIISNNVYYRLGLSYDFAGNREKAVSNYKLSKNQDKDDRPYDNYIYDVCQYYIKNPPSENLKKITEINNKVNQKNYDESILKYKAILANSELSQDEILICVYNLAICYYELKNYDEALNSVNQGITLKPGIMKHLVPYCLFKKGQVLDKMGKREESKAAYKNIYNYKNYYFQKRLEKSIEDELDKMK
jgi:tetratricopeptide (TPR) repeat protein